MDLIDFALPVGWLALGALIAWAVGRLGRDRGVERLASDLERRDAALAERLEAATAATERRLEAAIEQRHATLAAAVERTLGSIGGPAPVEDDAAARAHGRRRRVAPELFAAVRDLHRAAGDLVDELHGWPDGIDPPDLWDAVDTARARLHATFARTRIHLPTPVDTRIAEYRRLVKECLTAQRASEQLADARPQAARFAGERAAELLRAADEHFRRIEDDLRGMIEAGGGVDEAGSGATGPAASASGAGGEASRPAAPGAGGPNVDQPGDGGIRPRPRRGPTVTFESDLLDDDESDASDPGEGSRNGGGDPGDTRRPGD